MIGIPYRIARDSDSDGRVDKVIYLATRRMGEAGKALKDAKREYYKTQHACAKVALRYQAADARLKALPTNDKSRPAQELKIEEFLDSMRQAGEEAVDAAERVVRLSLTENYGKEKASEILDGLIDKDLHGCVQALEMGEQPKDFFPSGDPLRKPTSTSPLEEEL